MVSSVGAASLTRAAFAEARVAGWLDGLVVAVVRTGAATGGVAATSRCRLGFQCGRVSHNAVVNGRTAQRFSSMNPTSDATASSKRPSDASAELVPIVDSS